MACIRQVERSVIAACLMAGSAAGQEFVGPPAPDELLGTALAGQVFNGLGGGVQDAQVTVRRKNADGTSGDVVATATSDALGDFEIRLPQGGKGMVVVNVKKAGYAPFVHELNLAELSEDDFVEALMQGGQKLFGQVVSAVANRPIPEAKLVASIGGRELRAVSGLDGQFEVAGVPPGGGRLRVSAKGYGTESVPIDPAKITEPMIVTLKKERVLHVTVVDEKDKPVGGALIELIVGEGSDQRTEKTGANGQVAVRGLSQGAEKLRVRLSHDDFVKTGTFDQEIIPDAGELAPRVRLSLVRGGTVVGRVTGPEREPLFGVRLIAGADPDGLRPSQFTDAEGRYRLSGIPRGETVITVYHSFHAPQLLEVKIEPGREKRLDVRMRPGRPIAGAVIDPSGKGVESVRIVSSSWKGHSTLRLGAVTDAEGRFEFDHAPPGEIRFDLSAPGAGNLKEAVMEAGGTDYRIELDPAGAVAAAPAGPVAAPNALGPGDAAPGFDVTTLTGQKLSLKDLRGSYVFVDFWATWCPPCVGEIPMVKRLHAAMKDRDDFVLLSISLDREKGAVQRFVKQRKLEWHQAVGEDAGAGRAATAYQVMAIPSTFLIGPDGKIVAVNLRGEGLVQAVRKQVGDGP